MNTTTSILIAPILTILFSLLATANSRSQGLSHDLDHEFKLTIKDIPVRLPFSGNLNLFIPKVEEANVRLTGAIHLGDLNAKLKNILKRSVEYYDECGERLHVKGAKIGNIIGKNARVSIDLMFEKWVCTLGVKTRILRQSGNILLEIEPQEKDRGIKFGCRVIHVKADGLLGSLISSNSSIRKKIIEIIQRELPQAREASLSEEFNDIPVFEIKHPMFQTGNKLTFDLFAQAHRDILVKYIIEYKNKKD